MTRRQETDMFPGIRRLVDAPWRCASNPSSNALPQRIPVHADGDEGSDDMPAQFRVALTGVRLSIPLIDGRLALVTWEGVYRRASAHAA